RIRAWVRQFRPAAGRAHDECQAVRGAPGHRQALRVRVRFRIDNEPATRTGGRAHGPGRSASSAPARAKHAPCVAVRDLRATRDPGVRVLSSGRRKRVRVREAPATARMRRARGLSAGCELTADGRLRIHGRDLNGRGWWTRWELLWLKG